jgi:hypothetical protein
MGNKTRERAYSSAAFKMGNPGIFYQFKLWKTPSEPMFGLVKKGSRALASINAGDIITMTYYFQDKTMPTERRVTRVKSISDGNDLGYKDHFVIALDLDSLENSWDAV